MAVTDKKLDKAAGTALHTIVVPITTAINQTGLLVGAFTPGYAFQIHRVAVMATAVTATITVDVQIGGTTVLTGAITPVAGTETAGTLSTTLSARRGTSTSQIQVKYTSNGTGAGTNLSAYVTYRAYPMNGDAAL